MSGRWAVTAAAAGIAAAGIARRLSEVRRAGAGARGASAENAPSSRAGLTGRLDTWIPAPPASATSRLLAAAWTAPLTTVGGVLAGLGGTRAHWDGQRQCWVALGVGGPSAWILERMGLRANTIGQVVLVRTPDASDTLLDHEAVHVRPAERLGPVLPLLYGVYSARHGYWDNPFERAARAGAGTRPPTASVRTVRS